MPDEFLTGFTDPNANSPPVDPAHGAPDELVREGPGWRIIKVTGVWET